MAPQPLPPTKDDPSITAGYAAKAAATEQYKAIRFNFGITDMVKAEQIDAAWHALNAELTRLYTDLQARRIARLEYLQGLIPIGPDIPTGASPADRAVLQAEFRAAYTRAQEADYGSRRRMLAEAERFDDDATRRAVLTVGQDQGETKLLDQWAAFHPELAGLVPEMLTLRQLIAGQHFDNAWVRQALSVERQPDESRQLPQLQATRDAAEQALREQTARTAALRTRR